MLSRGTISFSCLAPLFLAAGAFAQTTTFTSGGAIPIPTAAGNSTVYPTASPSACANNACITVSGMTGAVQNVTLRFNNWTTPGNATTLAILLQGPAAGSNGVTALDVLSNVCVSAGTFTLSDAGSANATTSSCFGSSATMKPTTQHFSPWAPDVFSNGPASYQRAEPDSFPFPATNGTSSNQSCSQAGQTCSGTFAYVFNGMASANGVWRLFVTNQFGTSGPTGSIGSWSLTITTAGAGTSTTTTITSHTPNPSLTSLSPVTLTAQVSSANTGNVLFHDNGVAGNGLSGAGDLGTAAVNSSGVATLSNVQFATEGAHQIIATYQGGGSFAASTSAVVNHEVIKTSTLQASPPSGTVGFCNTGGIKLPSTGATPTKGPASPYPSSIVVSGQSGIIQDLRVYLNSYTSSQPASTQLLLVGPNGKTLDFGSNIGGNNAVSGLSFSFDDTAASQASGSVSFANGSVYKPTVIQSASFGNSYCTTASCNTIVVSEPAPGTIERAGPFGSPARTLSTQFDGGSPNGTWQLFAQSGTDTTTETIGNWCINFTLTNGAATTTQVTTSASPSATGAAVTFTATVNSGGNPVSSGSVIFSDSVTGTNLGTIAVSNGVAALTNITNLSEGTHIITASYGGNASFGPSSGTVSQQVNNPTVQTGTKFCNQASGISIPAPSAIQGASQPYPSNIAISGLPGTVNTVEVDLNAYNAINPSILKSLIVGPCQSASCALDFFSPSQSLNSGPFSLAFLDASPNTLPNSPSAAISAGTGTYKPFSLSASNTYAAPAPTLTSANYATPGGSPPATFGSIFANTDPNGTWSLYEFTNALGVNDGSIASWCVNLTINKPTLAISKTHTGPGAGNAFVVGQAGSYTLAVTNNGPGSTAGATVTVSDTMPSGVTVTTVVGGTDWNCNASTSTAVSCTSTTAVAAGNSFSNIVVNIAVASNAPSTVSNTATVSGGTFITGGSASDNNVTVIHPAILSLVNTDSGSPIHTFVQGDTGKTATFTLSNDTAANGAGATTSAVTITFTSSSGLTPTGIAAPAGWSCGAAAATFSCTSTGNPALAAGGSANFPITFSVGLNATSPQTIAATTSGGGANSPSSTDTLTVNSPPTVTTNPLSQSVSAGSNVSFTVAASGNPTPTVQWYTSSDGGVTFVILAGATNTTLSFVAQTALNGVQYRATFTNTVSSVNTTAATLTVTAGPVITTNPVDVTINAGGTAVFTAAASGTPTPTVQWFSSTDGTNFSPVSGATTTTLTLPSVTAGQNGTKYRAVFTNATGTATTTAATLTVNSAPTVTTNPLSQSVSAGSNVSFTVAASGNPTPTVQWYTSNDGGVTFVILAGATNTTLSFVAQTALNGVQYRATFTNTVSSVNTTAATLTVTAGPVITTNPVDVTINAGGTAVFTAAASGTPTPTVQWFSSTDGTNFSPVSGATTTTLTLPSVTAGQNGTKYRAVFTNATGTATTTAATLTVNSAPTVTTNPLSQSVSAGSNVSFTVAASGNPTPTVQWYTSNDGGVTFVILAGATNTTLSFVAQTALNGVQYRATFTNTVSSVNTTAATLTVTAGPVITTNPVDVTINAGGTAVFTAAASGTPTPTVQWFSSTDGTNFSPVSGATTTTLTLPSVTAGQNGTKYRAVFTNATGTGTTTAATLTVNFAPTVTTNPVSQSISAGSNVSFTAAATGNPTPTVQWEISTNGGLTFASISGATSTTLLLTAVPAGSNGNQYRAVFTNSVGSATTAAATLTVTVGPVVTTNPVNVTINAGGTAVFTAAASGSPTPTVQWFVSTDGINFSVVSGATTTTLTLPNVTAGQNGTKYRAVFTNATGTGTTTAATLTVTAGAPASMTANTGTTPQSATVNTAFANALAVTVRDATNNPLQGVNVTFTAPGSGASGVFSNNSTTITVATNTSGVASVTFTANGTPGGPYNVTASVIGLTSVNFSLTNTAAVAPAPTVTSFKVLWGSQSYEVIGTPRNRLPWMITGIQVTFSQPITSGDLNSLGGFTTTAFAGLGTNTLTWTINPVSIGQLNAVLSGTGAHALMNASGVALGNGHDLTQVLRILFGDYNDDGVVNAADQTSVLNLVRAATYNLFGDMNGDGALTNADVLLVRGQIGQTLP